MLIERQNYTIKDCRFTRDVKEKKELNYSIIEYPCYMFIDQATAGGACVFDKERRLLSTFYIEKQAGESNVEFRRDLRRFIKNSVEEFRIEKIFCEGVFGGPNFKTTELLISIKETIKDIGFELGVRVYPINNKKWKARLALPGKWDIYEDEKEQVKRHVKEYFPYIEAKEDVIDSLGMGIAVLYKSGGELKPLEMRLDKKLSIKEGVFVLDSLNNLYDLIAGSSFKKDFERLDVKVFDYDTSVDFGTNFRLILTNYNVLAVAEIPYHKYYGQILLQNGIKPSEIGEGVIIGVACRKHYK